MPFLRNVVKDLVEKRLWPVAALLAAALVAVPVVLGRTGGEDAPAAAATPAPPAAEGATADGSTAATRAVVSLDTGTPARRHLGGRLRDPFQGPKAPAEKTAKATAPTASSAAAAAVPGAGAASAGDTATPAATGSTGSAGSTGASGSSGTGSGSGAPSTPRTASKPKAKASTPKAEHASDTFHVSVRFGVNGADKLTTVRDVARLAPLPSVKDPFFVFLGVLSDRKTAVFLVSSDATPTGEATCRPSATACETIELRAGQTEYFDVAAADGTQTQYQLELAGIRRTRVQTGARAAMAYARHSVPGAKLLRAAAVIKARAAAGARSYRYLPARGVLVRAKRAPARAAADALIPGAAEAVALLPRERQPGIPVWRSPEPPR